MRDPYSTSWFDYDISVGISFPGAYANTDFDNHGTQQHASAGNFTDLNVGGTFQFGALGVAATGDLQQFSLSSPQEGHSGLVLQLGRWKALGAYAFFDGQLAVGGGARIVTMQILQQSGGTLLTMTGAAPEVGALLMPTGRPWRIGVTARAPVDGGIFGGANVTTMNGVRSVSGFVLPDQVEMPWEAELGFAYQLGPRPLNPGWENPHDDEAPLRRAIERDRTLREGDYQRELARLPPASREARRDAQEQGGESAAEHRGPTPPGRWRTPAANA